MANDELNHVKRLEDREKYFAKALSVADGGQYRADWVGAIRRVLAERDSLRQQLAAAERATDAAQAEAAAMRKALSVATTPLPEDREMVRAALAGTTGRELAERVPLWRELETLVRNAQCCDGEDAHWSDAGKEIIAKLAALDALTSERKHV